MAAAGTRPELLDVLGRAIDGIESKYMTQGQWTMPSSLKLTLAADNTPITFPMQRGAQPAEMARLHKAADPSPFGKGKETVVDESVRKAHELKPDAFSLSGGFDVTVPAEVLEKVRAELVPDATSISAKLHKVNVYEKGGFFAEHRDTPRSDTHFGSLVVLLPSYHKGGALAL